MGIDLRYRVLVIVSLLGAAAAVRAQEAPATGSISGRVLVAGSPAPVPIRRARVTLDGTGGRQVMDSDTDGRYAFHGLAPGTFVVTADKPGFVALAAGALRPSIRPAPVTLAAGASLSLDVLLPRGAALVGRVLDDRREPAQSVTVGAFRLTMTPQGRRPLLVTQATTDDRGHYRLHSLASGAYFVEAANTGPVPARAGLPGEPATGLTRTWFPGASRVTDAQAVRVEPGETRADLDIEMMRVPVTRLVFRVLDAAGRAPRIVACRIRSVGGVLGAVSGFLNPTVPNVCEFPAVPAGDYWLLAAARPAPGAPAHFGAMQVSVAGEDLGELVLRTTAADPIDGIVEADDGEAWSVPPALHATALPALYEMPSPDRDPGAYAERPATVSSAGQVRFVETFGPTVFRLQGLPPGWALASVRLDDREVADRAADLTPVGRPRTLRFVVTRRTARLSGTVTSAPGTEVAPGTRVVVFAEDPAQWGAFSRHVIAVMPDANGRFECGALLPATYFAALSDDLADDDWNDPAVLNTLARGATKVALAAGDHPNVTLVPGKTR